MPGPNDPYAARTAPLALLRTYASRGQWVSFRQGFVLFEDDRRAS